MFAVDAIRRDGDVIDADISVTCSSGTYIRALARDVGAQLAVGGHLTALRRTRVGPFDAARARTLEQLSDQLEIIPLAAAAAAAFDRRDLTADEALQVGHGIRLPALGTGAKPVAAFGPDGTLVALLTEEGGRGAVTGCVRGRPAGRELTCPVARQRGRLGRVGRFTYQTRRMWEITDMQRWQGLAEVPDNFGPSVVTIGVFDGVHRGHQRIVHRARAAASELGLPVVVVTFDPHPVEVVRPGSHPPFLCTPRRMSELLTRLGVDAACVIEFTLEFSRLDPDEFVRAVLVDKLHAARVVVGEDFRFGHKAAGDVALLADLGEKYDFTVEGVPLLTEDGVRISSTEIRARLAEGDVEGAAHDLGRPHRVEGVVVRGHQRGRALGFPTANLETLPHTAIPADGVYAGWLDPAGY